ncbi:MAG: dihydroorotate dehydrogenase electron transfer subunit [Candidatus Micrarchaeota archaeon]
MIPRKTRITNVDVENKKVKTFRLDLAIDAKPGQFVMVWIPGVDEKPFCVAGVDPLRLTVANVGPFSKRIHTLHTGDSLWVRGPFGNGFSIKGKKAMLVGGGYGVAPMRFLAERTMGEHIETRFIAGAKTKGELLTRPIAGDVIVCTDDGSEGERGFVTDYLKKEIHNFFPDCVYACGPEIMLLKILEMCDESGIETQLSLERYMKCGFGICGQCSIGGLMVCKDGPVFTGKQLKGIADFGKRKLDQAGRCVEL